MAEQATMLAQVQTQLKFKAEAKDLVAALERVEAAIEKRTTIPILGCVELVSTEAGLRARGTDLVVGVEINIAAQVSSQGQAVVRLPPLLDMVRTLDGEVEVETRLDGHLNLKSKGVKTRIFGMKVDFERAFFEALTPKGTFEAADFRTLTSRTVFSVMQKDETSRFTLNCLKVTPGAGVLEMVGTDGHRLSFATAAEASPANLEMLIHLRAVPLVCSLAPEGGRVEFSESQGRMGFKFGGEQVWIQKSFAQFPNWRPLIPTTEAKASATIAAGDLEKVLRRAAIVCDERKYCQVTFEPGVGIRVYASNEKVGEISDVIECQVTGEKAVCAYNADYFLEYLTKALGDISLSVYDPDKNPLVIRQEGWMHCLMPMHLKKKEAPAPVAAPSEAPAAEAKPVTVESF